MVLKRESELGDCAGSSDPRQREIVSEIAAPLESRQTPSCTRRNGVDQSANGSKVELADMPPRYQTNNRGCRRHGGGTVDTGWPSHGRNLGGCARPPARSLAHARDDTVYNSPAAFRASCSFAI